MANTITSQYGGTIQGNQVQNFQDILRSITGSATPMSPQIAQQGQQSAMSTQLAMNLGQPAFEEQAKQSLTEQSGIPQLQGQYGDLAKLFELYLADGNLASKYTKQANTNPYAGGEANPYMAPTDQLVEQATAPDSTAPGGGFTDPSMVTAAMGAPVNATSNLLDLINQAIGIQGGKVDKKMGDVSANYQKSLDTLGVLANVFGTAYEKAEQARKDAANKKRETGFNKKGDLVDLQTGEIIKEYDGTDVASSYIKERALRSTNTIDELMDQVNHLTTGVGSLTKDIPGTPAKTFASQLNTLKSNIAVNELTAMREASKTGGALGQVSNKEIGLLEDSLAGMDQAQSPEDFKKQLKKAKDSIIRWESAVGGASPDSSGETRVLNGVTYKKVTGGWQKIK